MKDTENHETALEKLARARKIVRSGTLTKSGENDFAHWKYFELEDFLPKILDALMEVKLTPTPVTFTTETATLILVDPVTKEEIVTTSPMSTANLPGCHAVQNLGAVQTYLRRYLWQSAFEVLETDTLTKTKPPGNDGKKQEEPLPTRPRAEVKVPPRSPQREDSAPETLKGLIDFDKTGPYEGVNKQTNKPWKKYRITLENGETATTFDEDIFNGIKGWDILHEAEVRVTKGKFGYEWLDTQKVETPELPEGWQ